MEVFKKLLQINATESLFNSAFSPFSFSFSSTQLNLVSILCFAAMVSCTHGHCRKAVESKHDGHTTDILNDSGVPKPPLATSEGNTGLGNAKPSGANRRVWVYKYDGSLQCNMGQALSLNAMAQQLAGIKVYSQMKKNDGKARGAVCDSPTGIANLYEIDVEALSKAEAKEFKEWKF